MHPSPTFPRSSRLYFGIAVLSLGMAGLSPAHADVKYTTVMSVAQDSTFKPMSTSTVWLKDGLERVDTKQEIGPVKMMESTITSAAKRNRITFDPMLKIYTVESLNEKSSEATSMPVSTGSKAATAASGTGKVIMTFATKSLGMEKLMDYQTRHNITTTAIDTSGCCGTGKSNYKVEEWRADIKLPTLAYPNDPNKTYGYSGDADGGKCKVSVERKGDVAAYEAAQKGLAIKTIMFDPTTGKALTSTQITMLSFAAVSDSEFAPPAGSKQLSRSEYDKQKQQGMMKAIMNRAKSGYNPAADTNVAEDAGTEVPGTEIPAAQAQPSVGEEQPGTTPDAENIGKEGTKQSGKNKLKKKFKLPF